MTNTHIIIYNLFKKINNKHLIKDKRKWGKFSKRTNLFFVEIKVNLNLYSIKMPFLKEIIL